jgi:hypothetical protein
METKSKSKTTWNFLTEEEMQKFYGERCLSFEPGCVVCAAWLRYDMLLQWEYDAINDRLDLNDDFKTRIEDRDLNHNL